MSTLLLQADALSKKFCRQPDRSLRYAAEEIWHDLTFRHEPSAQLRPGEFWALDGVSLELRAGEVLGILGHNGAGKSTLLNLLAGVIRPTRGEVRWYAKSVVLMDVQSGLNPIQTGRENIRNKLALYGFDSERIDRCLDDVIAYTGIGDFIDAAVGTYSTGMRLRLAFSIYTEMRPDVFIIDEALGGGDIQFRQKFESYLRRYIGDGGSILLISHDLFIVQSLCHRCVLLHGGKSLCEGPTLDVLQRYHDLLSVKMTEPASVSPPVSAPAGSAMVSAPSATAPELTERPQEIYGCVEMTQVSIEPADDRPLHPGGPARVRIRCQSKVARDRVLVGLMLRHGVHQTVALVVAGYGDSPCELKVGFNEYGGSIDRLPLMPGHYGLVASVLEPETHALLGLGGHDHGCFTADVSSLQDPALQMALGQKALMHLPVRWS